MTAPPEGLLFCKVTGRFRAVRVDGTDPDDLPEFVSKAGTARIVCNAQRLDYGTETWFPDPVECVIEDGQLAQGGRAWVKLLAPSEGLNPPDFNYQITVTFDTGQVVGPYSFDVVPGGEIDLTAALPVAVNGGVPITRGLPGPQGAASTVPGPPGHNPITVSATAPTSPAEGDIWFDIS